MRFYWPIAKIDGDQRMVWGYASTEALDDQGEIIKREALADALADYMRFANIREMHQPSAVGVAREAAVDDKGLYLGARIVDDEAWRKVVEGVYKGFSIGGRVTARDPADRSVISGLSLTEISIVDRPANPEAVFDCWKRAGAAAQPAADAGSSLRERLGEIVAALCDILDALAAEDGEPAGSGMNPPSAGIAAAAVPGLLRKAASPEGGPDRLALDKLAGEIVPRLDALQRRVDDIARTPLPAQTIARGFVAIGKREDSGLGAASADDIVAALARMTEEERALALIKAAHANPIDPFARQG